MKHSYAVINILEAIYCNEYSRSEINHLIELTHKFAHTYLRYRYKNLSKVLLAEDVTLQELAIDAIAPLFERDERGVFTKIKKTFEAWEPKIETEESALFFLNRIVAKSVEKYVSELLRNSDPFFSKILDSVNYLIEKNNYKKKQILGTTYIIENNDFTNIGTLPDAKFIYDLPVQLIESNNKLLTVLFAYIRNDTDKSPAIPLNALIIKIKQIRATGFNLSDTVTNNNDSEVESIVNKGLFATLAKMRESYIHKNKLDESEGAKINSALENIIRDMRDGGINPGLHKYFLEQFTEHSFEDYKQKYQNIFEYLFKVLKKEIADQLKD